MNNDQTAVNILVDNILKNIERKLRALSYDRSFSTLITSVNSNDTYNITYMGNTYAVKNGMSTKPTKGQMVWVMIPNNKLKDMFIYALK